MSGEGGGGGRREQGGGHPVVVLLHGPHRTRGEVQSVVLAIGLVARFDLVVDMVDVTIGRRTVVAVGRLTVVAEIGVGGIGVPALALQRSGWRDIVVGGWS